MDASQSISAPSQSLQYSGFPLAATVQSGFDFFELTYLKAAGSETTSLGQKKQESPLLSRDEASAESDVGQTCARPSVSSVGTREKKTTLVLQQPLEPRLSCSEQSLGLIEESQRRLSELIKRNEEKRGVICELAGQVEELKKENQALHEKNRKLIEGNYNKNPTQRSANYARASGISMKNSNHASFAKLKATLMGAFRVRKHKNVK